MTRGSADAQFVLAVITGVSWTIVYINAIWIGLRQKTYAMPMVALALNFAWELTYATIDTRTAVLNPNVDTITWAAVETAWAVADILLVYTFFRFGRTEFPTFVTREMFVTGFFLAFGASCVVQWLIIAQFGADVGVRYSAFLQTVVMSALFIAMFAARQGLRGQTLTIAVGKCIGTLAATILYGWVEPSMFILGLGAVCFVLDVAYIGLVVWARRQSNDLSAPTPVAEPVPA